MKSNKFIVSSDMKTNRFTVRIYDMQIWRNLEELQKADMFENFNMLINKAIDIGAETLLGRLGKAKLLADGTAAAAAPKCEPQLAAIEKRLKDLQRAVDEVFVVDSITQTMVTTLYNVEIADIHGEEVSAELMDCGYFSTLPDMLQAVYNEMIPKNKKDG